MGFFKDFKNDMKQAVNELIPGNEEMANEYDDEDMVNTLDEDSEEDYINTMDSLEAADEQGAADQTVKSAGRTNEDEMMDDLDDLDLDDLDELELDDVDLDDSSSGYESDMDSLANLLSGNIQVEDLENQDIFAAEKPMASDEPESFEEEDNVLLANSELMEEEEQADMSMMSSADQPSGDGQPYEQMEFADMLKPEEQVASEASIQPEEAVVSEDAVQPEALKGADDAIQPDTYLPEDNASQDSTDVPWTENDQIGTQELVDDQKEDAVMSDDKVINITSIKEPEPAISSMNEEPEKVDPVKASLEAEGVSDSTTYITKGTRIEGNLFTDGSLDILGTVEGDVNCYGKLIISGSITGKVNAGEIYANAAKIEGEVTSAGSVKIGVGSVIVGNIDSQSAVIAGAVNGDLDVKGPVIVDSTAVIMGNIKSRSVQINNGAVIEGFCSQCYSDIDVKSFFA